MNWSSAQQSQAPPRNVVHIGLPLKLAIGLPLVPRLPIVFLERIADEMTTGHISKIKAQLLSVSHGSLSLLRVRGWATERERRSWCAGQRAAHCRDVAEVVVHLVTRVAYQHKVIRERSLQRYSIGGVDKVL